MISLFLHFFRWRHFQGAFGYARLRACSRDGEEDVLDVDGLAEELVEAFAAEGVVLGLDIRCSTSQRALKIFDLVHRELTE